MKNSRTIKGMLVLLVTPFLFSCEEEPIDSLFDEDQTIVVNTIEDEEANLGGIEEEEPSFSND